MKRILLSLATIVAVGSVVAGATVAAFTSQAVLGSNTFATGVLEIRIDGLAVAPGFTFSNAKPGDVVSKPFSLQNYGLPWFGGPSTLNAKELTATSSKTAGDLDLYNGLDARLYANAGWGGCSNAWITFVAGKGCLVYSGALSAMSAADILDATQWGVHPDLIPGNSFSMLLEVELPISAPTTLQGKSVTFDLLVDASNP